MKTALVKTTPENPVVPPAPERRHGNMKGDKKRHHRGTMTLEIANDLHARITTISNFGGGPKKVVAERILQKGLPAEERKVAPRIKAALAATTGGAGGKTTSSGGNGNGHAK